MTRSKAKKTIIALTGMMGCGKTTTAAELARLLPEFQRIEMDEIIEQRENKSINEIFAQNGETYFRNAEAKLLDELCTRDNLIISMGGGAFLSEKNRTCIENNAISIYLSANADTIFERVKNDKSRPLLKSDNPKQRIKELLKKRIKNYQKADAEVKTDNKSTEQIAQEILEIYKKYGNS